MCVKAIARRQRNTGFGSKPGVPVFLLSHVRRDCFEDPNAVLLEEFKLSRVRLVLGRI